MTHMFPRVFLVICSFFLAQVVAVQTAQACSSPDTDTEATDAAPVGKEQPAEDALDEPAEEATGEEITEEDPVLLSFKAGYDVDADPNQGYFRHPHLAYTEIVIFDQATQSPVVEELVPVWDYEAAEARAQQTYDKIESLTIDPLPAGSYRFQTRAIFELHDDTIEGDPASAVFSVVQALADQTPASDEPAPSDPAGSQDPLEPTTSTTHSMVGGCDLAHGPAGANGLPWLAMLAFALVVVGRRRR